MLKILSLSLIAIYFFSCKNFTILSKSVYSNHFKISESKLERYLLKNGIDTSNLFFANDSFYLKIFTPQFQSDSSIGLNSFRPIQFRVFDSSGKIVNTWANCYGPLSYYIKDYSDFFTKKINPDLNLNTSLNDYYSMMKDKPKINFQYYDIIILEFWQWYMGDYSLKMLRELKSLSNSQNKKVLLIKLNMDNSK